MRRVSKQEWENEHMHDPMTEGEALAVLRELRDTGDVSDWQAMESALTMAVNRLTAHTAASGGEVAGWQRRYRTEGMEWSRWHGWEPDGREDPFPKTSGRWSNEFRPVYTAPPAVVPADALERLVEKWRENESTCVLRAHTIRHECADELAALIPKGAAHEQR